MFDTGNIVVITLMLLLFLRQFAVFKQASKINYAPLILILGLLGSLLYFMVHSQETSPLLLREALLPLFSSLLLYFILNILNQTQQSSKTLEQEALQAQFLSDIDEMKQDIAMLHEREYHLEDIRSDTKTEHVEQMFKKDIETLQQIQKNQEAFMEKYDKSMQGFKEFTEIKMPEFDAIIHRHIEILRITEQDHFNYMKQALESSQKSHKTLHANLNEMHKLLGSIKHTHAAAIGKVMEQAASELKRLFTGYETRLTQLQSQSETLGMGMRENELLLERLKERSDVLLGQITQISKQMDTMLQTAQTLPNLDHLIETLSTQRHDIHEEMSLLKAEVSALKERLGISENMHEQRVEDVIETLSKTLNEKVDYAMTKLYEQYFSLQNSNASTMKELASRSKMQQTYLSNSSKE